MLQDIRDRSQGWITWVIIIVICVSFALWGIQNYLHGGGAKDVIAKVNGIKITRADVMTVYRQLSEQQQQIGEMSPAVEQQLKLQALRQLVTNQVVLVGAHDGGFAISTLQVNYYIQQLPYFHENGKFSINRYKQIVSRMTIGSQEFKQQLRNQLLMEQIQAGFVASAFALSYDVQSISQLVDQERDINYLLIDSKDFKSKVKVSEQEAEDFYEQHKVNYKTPEKVKVNYIELSMSELAKQISVSDEELQDYYKTHQKDFLAGESWQVQAFLVNLSNSIEDESKNTKALEIAQDISRRLQKGESGRGIERSYRKKITIEKPTWMPKKQVLSGLSDRSSDLNDAGDVTQPLRTVHGFEVLKLIDEKPSRQRPYNEVKKEIRQLLAVQQAEAEFAEKSEQLAQLAYEYPQSLDKASDILALSVKTTDWFSRQSGSDSLTTHKNVIAAAFNSEVLHEGFNSDVIALQPQDLLIIRIAEHQPSKIQDFSQVQQKIKNSIAEQKQQQLAEQASQKIVERLQDGDALTTVAKEYGLTIKNQKELQRSNLTLDPLLVEEIFNLPQPIDTTHAVFSDVALSNGNFAVVVLLAVHQGDADDRTLIEQRLLKQQVARNYGQLDYDLYVESLTQKAKVKENLNALQSSGESS